MPRSTEDKIRDLRIVLRQAAMFVAKASAEGSIFAERCLSNINATLDETEEREVKER